MKIVTIEGDEQRDLEIELELVPEPGASILAIRVADKNDRAERSIWATDDYTILDLTGMRELRSHLHRRIAQVEALEAILAVEASVVVHDEPRPGDWLDDLRQIRDRVDAAIAEALTLAAEPADQAGTDPAPEVNPHGHQ